MTSIMWKEKKQKIEIKKREIKIEPDEISKMQC